MTRRTRWTTIVVVVVLAALAVLVLGRGGGAGDGPAAVVTSSPANEGAPSAGSGGRADDPVRALFDGRRTGVEVQGTGVVSRILSDDLDGSQHQRFILTTPSGVSILVAHNIDIAPRLDGLAIGDTVAFLGDYEWSAQGGTVHWTHHDPSGRHQNGWLKWKGRTYA